MITNESAWVYGWRRTALLTTLLLVSVFSQVDRILPFILAESMKAELHLSDTQLGLITGIAFSVCFSLASLPLARIADMGRAKQVLILCILIWSAMTGFGGLATGFMMLALSRLGVAFGEAGGTPASHALIARKIPAQFRGRAIGLFSMGIPLGTMLGFSIGGWANDHIGWRNALFGAGAFGVLLTMMVVLFTGREQLPQVNVSRPENILSASRSLLKKPAFLWLFIAANLLGFASAPFYTFTTPFLIRTHGLTTSQVGLAFGLLQGLMGIIGTLIGGRQFDKALSRGAGRLMNPPAIAFSIAAITTLTALFAPASWMSIALFVPGMFSFSFLLPHAIGAAHLVAGPGKQALSSSLMLIGAGLLGSALSPLFVGMISDAANAAHIENGLRLGLLIVPVFSLLSGIACFIVSRRIAMWSKEKNTDTSDEEPYEIIKPDNGPGTFLMADRLNNQNRN